jgi:tetratricopeptide (TPR) repeat protein
VIAARPARRGVRWPGVVLAAALSWPGVALAAPKRLTLEQIEDRVDEAQKNITAAEKAAGSAEVASEAELAKRLVKGQLDLEEGDWEGSAIIFLDLVENHRDTPAGIQAVYYLGDALAHMGLERWAYDLFSKNLADTRPEARRKHQDSVARLFDLAAPRRDAGFAQKPGLSATPEVRARLRAVGIDPETKPPRGIVKEQDAERLVGWARSFPAKSRGPELRYSFGRFLFLTGQHSAAQTELDGVSPLDIPLTRGGVGAKWRVRAAYVAAAATLALGETEDALDRFARITKVQPSDPRDRQIVELAWMAQGRILHDIDDADEAVRAYRHIGRDSAFFPEAMYETAWTLLRAGRYEQAVQALDLLLIYDPQSPIVAEIKQLRGKVRIQQRDYEGAEEQFLALRREFDRVAKQLGGRLQSKGDAQSYFSAVVAEDMENFSLESVLPVRAAPIARTLPRAVQAESIARETGELDRELTDLEDTIARLQAALQAERKAALFTDLAAHAAGLGNADGDLLDIEEALVDRLALEAKGASWDTLESQRAALRKKVDAPLGQSDDKEAERVRGLMRLEQKAHKLELTVSEMRAQLVATERYYEETRAEQKIDHQGFLTEAAAMRDGIAQLEKETAALRRRISRQRSSVRYGDPRQSARDQAVATYRRHLDQMYGALFKANPDAEAGAIWNRVQKLEGRSDAAKVALENTARVRLEKATIIVAEERINITGYREELGGLEGRARSDVAEVLAATHSDVHAELNNFVMRSEVGLLDVAWAMKDAETDQVHQLEVNRDRDLRELDVAVEMGLEALEQ